MRHCKQHAVWLQVRWPIDKRVADDPHAKANLMIQAHLSGLQLPISDYVTDTKTVLDNSLRILQARRVALLTKTSSCVCRGTRRESRF